MYPTYPFCRIEIQVFNLAMLKERRKTDAVVGDVWLLANHDDVVLSSLRVLLDNLLTIHHHQSVSVFFLSNTAATVHLHQGDGNHPQSHHDDPLSPIFIVSGIFFYFAGCVDPIHMGKSIANTAIDRFTVL